MWYILLVLTGVIVTVCYIILTLRDFAVANCVVYYTGTGGFHCNCVVVIVLLCSSFQNVKYAPFLATSQKSGIVRNTLRQQAQCTDQSTAEPLRTGTRVRERYEEIKNTTDNLRKAFLLFFTVPLHFTLHCSSPD